MDRIQKVRQRLQTRMNPRFLARATRERKWKFAEIRKTAKWDKIKKLESGVRHRKVWPSRLLLIRLEFEVLGSD